MSNWNPKPLRPQPKNPLFPLVEGETIIKSETPIEVQRRKDGTPITRMGAMAVQPPDPVVFLKSDLIKKGSLVEQYAPQHKELPKLSPEETLGVIKSYLNMNVVEPQENKQVAKLKKSIADFSALVQKLAGTEDCAK